MTDTDNKCFDINLDNLKIVNIDNRFELKASRKPEELNKILQSLTDKEVYLIDGELFHTYGYVRKEEEAFILVLDTHTGMNLLILTHELAHIHCGIGKGHNKNYMKEWRRLCYECLK